MHGSPTFLMCPPEYFDVEYVINPWMHGNVLNVESRRAKQQWRGLYDVLSRRARVRLVMPQPSSPDMVFTANAGLVRDHTVLLSRFRHEQRQYEEPFFAEWFSEHDYDVHVGPLNVPFEGAGDAIVDPAWRFVWLGHGHRTVPDAAPLVSRTFGLDVVPLELIDPRFYHLDTCFCPLPQGEVLYHPNAFSAASLAAIEARIPRAQRIECASRDAIAFACNAVAWDTTIVLHEASPALEEDLVARGYTVLSTPLGEFLKAGGSAKCLTLRLE